MIKRILIIGGYGNFGQFISKKLATEKNIQIIVGGRSIKKAKEFILNIDTANEAEAVEIDINKDFALSLSRIKPNIVIHTSGPFQTQGYEVAHACIALAIHYIDLADGRDFVDNIVELNEYAKENNVLIMSGASSVPCLTSALVNQYKNKFEKLDSLEYCITTAQKTARGLATTEAILGYTGKPFNTLINGKQRKIYGWQGLKVRKFQELGWKLMGNCDVPDLSLFPKYFPELKTIRFYAGLEIPFIHITLWILSWIVRVGLIKNLQKAAPILLRISSMFDWLGSDNSAFHMRFSGEGKNGVQKTTTFELIARSGDGPFIPCMPVILIAKKLVNGEISDIGAFPCIGFISLDEYLDALSDMDISWNTK